MADPVPFLASLTVRSHHPHRPFPGVFPGTAGSAAWRHQDHLSPRSGPPPQILGDIFYRFGCHIPKKKPPPVLFIGVALYSLPPDKWDTCGHAQKRRSGRRRPDAATRVIRPPQRLPDRLRPRPEANSAQTAAARSPEIPTDGVTDRRHMNSTRNRPGHCALNPREGGPASCSRSLTQAADWTTHPSDVTCRTEGTGSAKPAMPTASPKAKCWRSPPKSMSKAHENVREAANRARSGST